MLDSSRSCVGLPDLVNTLYGQQITNASAAHVRLTVASLASQTEVPRLSEYVALLQDAGFSGIDSGSDSISPFSVFVSRAVDAQITPSVYRLPVTRQPLMILLISGRRFQTYHDHNFKNASPSAATSRPFRHA